MHALTVITRALDGPAPRPRPAPAFRRWIPAAALATATALAALLWVEVAVWRAVTYVPPSMRPEEASAMLTEVSLALFSMNGYSVEAPEDAADEGTNVCDGADWLVTTSCTPARLAHAGLVSPADEELR